MQAQASLKEAEAARVMNLIILPFTVVTVIFVRYNNPSVTHHDAIIFTGY